MLAAASFTETFDGDASKYVLTNYQGMPASLSAVAGHGQVLNLTYESVGGTLNTVAFQSVSPQPFVSMTAEFDLRMLQGSRADGLGFIFLNSDVFGNAGPSPSFSEDPNVAKSFGVGFDTYINGPFAFTGSLDDGGNDITLHYDGKQFASVTLTDVDLANGNFLHVSIQVSESLEGCEVSVLIRDTQTGKTVLPYNRYLIPGMVPYAGRPAFSARTGTNDSGIMIDDVVIQQVDQPVTVRALTTTNVRPSLSGAIDSPQATVIVAVGGRQYVATNDGVGSWVLPGTRLRSPLTPGVYEVCVAAVLPDGQVLQDITDNELWVVDAASPSALITATSFEVSSRLWPVVTIRLSEESDNFTDGDFQVSSGFLSPLRGAGTTFFSSFRPWDWYLGQGTVSIPAGAFTNRSGKGNVASTIVKPFAIETLPATVGIAAVNTRLYRDQTTSIRIGLSQQTNDFTIEDLSATGGTVSDLQGGGAGYWATFTPTPGFSGVANVFVRAAAFADSSGTPSPATSLAVPLLIESVLLPTTPTGLGVVQGDSQASVSWSPPVSDGGAPVTGYIVEYSVDNGLSWKAATDKPVSGTTATVTGLRNGTSHLFRVAAMTSAGVGSPSEASLPVIPATPMIQATGSLVALTTTYGTPSAPTSISVSGTNLASSIVVTVPSGLEVSSDNTTYAATAILNASNSAVNGTVFVRLASKAAAGAYSGNLTLASTGATSVNVPIPASAVATKPLTVTGINVQPKTYDGTTAATLAGTATYSGLAGGESFSVLGAPTAVFADKNVGAGKTVTVAGYLAPSGNYTITQPTGLLGDITQRNLIISGIIALPKTYDGTTAATLAGTATYSGLAGGESFSVLGAPTAVFADRNVGVGKTVTVAGYLSPSGNYTITQPTGLTATISPKALVITGVSAQPKTYDGTTAATLAGTPTLFGKIGEDDVIPLNIPTGTFDTKNAGTGRAVTVSGISLAGTTATNYSLAPLMLSADILPKQLVVVADNKTRAQGTDNPSFTTTITGFTAGETAANALAGAAGLSTTATKASPVGVYTIQSTVGTLTANNGNYFFTFTNGTLSVITTPAAPTKLRAIPGRGRVTLTWVAPTNQGNSPVTEYSIQYRRAAASTWTTVGDAVFGATSSVVAGLVNGRSYVFRVFAKNAAGTGPASANSVAVTPRA